MTPEELLNLAKGIKPNEQLTEEMEKLQAQAYWEQKLSGKPFARLRKEVRRTLFTTMKKRKRGGDMSLKEQVLVDLIDEQLDSNFGLHWDTFTFKWDIAPTKQTSIILKEVWTQHGGAFDEIGMHLPTAFTKQVIE